jgi:hypothetical protein
MKLRHALALILGSSLISSALPAFAAGDKPGAATNAVPGKNAATNAAPATIIVAASRFNIPTSTVEGRDPFFPNSARLQSGTVKSADPKARPTISLLLKGISGNGINRVALINNTTFKAGDTGMVTANNGAKVEVTCLSIGDESALVESQGVRQELRLRQPF